MANRVTYNAVQKVTGTALDKLVVDVYVTAANSIVTRELADEDLTKKQLEQIELFLAAHLVTVNHERQPVSESVDPASIRYSDIFARGIDSTTYGQTVIQLDPTGKIARSTKKTISIKAVKEEHEFRYTDNPNV